ncbi:hypothetical protein D7X30_06485 [Corallococcus sp. AB011P]|uniref:hypothetical protein n=1 Tax=Corallococcus sp. AB011P TaxID=2316735 RepID=UPI000EA1F34E|nr:hypothetical protein [Corallococcus sp. AB011P]RKG60579.1 hypothetical protein D7X30_06485 [Corallococcus sp. AB011P]
MRYFTKQQGQKEAVPVDLESLGQDRYRLTVNGKTFQVDALSVDQGTLSLLVDGQSYFVELQKFTAAVAKRGLCLLVHIG